MAVEINSKKYLDCGQHENINLWMIINNSLVGSIELLLPVRLMKVDSQEDTLYWRILA
jgi:hypothetical protein